MSTLKTNRISPVKWIFVGLLFVCTGVEAQIKLPKVLSSNMVLQRSAQVNLWGWSNKNEKVTITGSWLDESVRTKADKSGKWIVSIPTTDSKDPQSIRISDSSSEIALSNVVFGEVWLCSGQSNMERTLKGTRGEPILHSSQTIAHSTNPNLRLFTIERNYAQTPEDDLGAVQSWSEANPSTVADFSAVAYHFGSQLQEILGVPVGLIYSSWGGSDIVAWMGEDELRNHFSFDLNDYEIKEDWDARKVPTVLFNSMIYPIKHFSIKGAIWYQGESNRNNPAAYRKLLPAMVANWRSLWKQGDFPFYYVQIAPFDYRKTDAYKAPDNSAFLREAQFLALKEIPNSGIAITMDIGKEDNIHPPFKKEVGDRLLYQALNKTYDFKAVDADGPTYKSMEIKQDSLILSFDHAENGMYAPSELANFEIAGSDRIFYPATAKFIERKSKIILKSDQVPNPKAGRYGWNNWVQGSLFDSSLLPASSFRTDDWEDATKALLNKEAE
ncbi:MAG: sialate O-acetylesterase [Cyclobacteriaceae bacterium]|uniref:sialate O-acetylesterase n=1 Tax=Reichenbachiella sp. TaxID=2184521 RepID=UPI003267E944